MSVFRRRVLTAALAVMAGSAGLAGMSIAGAAAATPAKKALVPVTFAVSSTSISLLPEYLCVKDNFCQKRGLNVDYIDVLGGPASIAAVQSGSIEFAVVSSFQVFSAVAQGATVIGVSQETQGFDHELFLNNSVIAARHIKATKSITQALNDIHGLTIGNLGTGTTDGLIMAGLLRKYHYPPNWINFANVTGVASQLAALQHGTIDGVLTSPGTPELATAAGYGKTIYSLGNLSEFLNAAGGIMIVNTNWAKAHAKVVHDFVHAYDDTQKWMSTHQVRASQQMADLFSVQANVALPTYKHTNYPATAYMPAVSWRNAQDLANDYGLSLPPVTNTIEHEVYTNRYF